MDTEFTPQQAYEFGLLPLVAWREAQNQGYAGMLAVAWSIRNRVEHPSWAGDSYPSVILKHYQYSSFNWTDPNSQKEPKAGDSAWPNALRAAMDAYLELVPEPTGGAVNYFDTSLDPMNGKPDRRPKWALDGSMVHTVDVGKLHFYRIA